jgi:DNA replication licensing factor MCM5
MIFIVKDDHNENRDRTIAKHVMNIHMNRPTGSEAVGEIDVDKMKRYVAFCKTCVRMTARPCSGKRR